MHIQQVLLASKMRKSNRELADVAREAELEQSLEFQRWDSIWEAHEFIKAFVQSGWASYSSSITIDCDLTLDDLHQLGYLPRSQGTRACRRLVRVPVINEEIGVALWQKLKAMVAAVDGATSEPDKAERAKTNESLSKSQNGNSSNGEDDSKVSAKIARERLKQEVKAMRQEHKEERKKKQNSRRQSQDEQPAARPQPVCVFCREGGTGSCKIPAEIVVSPSSPPMAPKQSGNQQEARSSTNYLSPKLSHSQQQQQPQQPPRRSGIFPRRRSSGSRAGSRTGSRRNSCSEAPQGIFWQREEPKTKTAAATVTTTQISAAAIESGRAASASSADGNNEKDASSSRWGSTDAGADAAEAAQQHGSRLGKLTDKLRFSKLVGSLSMFGESISYGYGNRVYPIRAAATA
ncbi:hypothetical protein B0T26DRAFT_786022 [Lasiosphaeria miniovina]|uniref:Uncharacterized protein n=1 Tax=Lasiosphaeria miniovina TaxID=1954250 RepID=A0AA40A5N0_9PEZI|nr:uncharacterized protein B0T26DRAFT_786022 [Lasiosphaeria miniovina]KAK0709635.1 hypothetical protein B0T26DRAFT_786022 [Lasiosphaeria miniovina]